MRTLRARPEVVGLSLLAVAVRIAFAGYTGRVWEDALITIAHARSAIEGTGLTHHVGEPVTHGFTSAISVLIPLVGEVVVRGSSLVALRIASLIAVVVAIAAADALGRHLGLSRAARILVMAYLALDPLHIFYGVSGMETQVAVGALLVSVWAGLTGHRLAGVSLGIALLARPDFLIWAVCLGAWVFITDRRRLMPLLIGATAIVAPWIAFTTLYYGSPIPQTIVAKAAAFTSFPDGLDPGTWAGWLVATVLTHVSTITRTFAPFLEDSLATAGPLPTPVLYAIGLGFLVLAAVGAGNRWRDPAWTPLLAFVGAYLGYRVLFLPSVYFDWYVPPFTAITIFFVGAGVDRLATRRMPPAGGPARARTGSRWSIALVGGLIVLVALPLPWTFQLERTIQRDIEDGVRTPMSARLGQLVAAGDPVVAESAGYVGYVSRVTLFDFPGLTSRTSLAAIRALPRGDRTLPALIAALRPPWIVLRPSELAEFQATEPTTASSYEIVEQFGTPRESIEWGGYVKRTVDAAYLILRRRSAES